MKASGIETKGKHIKFSKPMPTNIRQAIEQKKDWKAKVQSGEIPIPTEKLKKVV